MENEKENFVKSIEENNSEKLLPNTPEEQTLTINDFDSIEELYQAYENKKAVELPPWIIEKDKRVTISPQELFTHIKENYHILSVNLGNSKGLVLYLYKNGFYNCLKTHEWKAFIKSFMPRKIRTSSNWEEVYKELKTEYADTEESKLNYNEDIINFENGVLNIKTNELLPHDPKHISTIQIPCNFIPNLSLSTAKSTIKFLYNITDNNIDDIVTILEIIALVISNVKCPKFKKCLFLKGVGNSGKTVLRELVQSLIGMENCHTLDISQLHSKFGLSGIYGKRLVGSGDLKFSRLPEIDKIKELTGNDHVHIEAKYQDAFTFQFTGFLWYNCNELPAFSGDKGEHVYDRFLILSCDKSVPPEERDPNLLTKLLKEKEIIVSVAIKILQQAINRDYKFTESERTLNNRKEYAIKNDSLALFLNTCCVVGESKTSTRVFKEKYIQWCRDNGLSHERPNDIRELMKINFNIDSRKSNGDYYELTIKNIKDI